MQTNVKWDDETQAIFVCKLCKKSFYNAVALQNHMNTHHDGEASGSDSKLQIPTYCVDQDYGDFKFIPSNEDAYSNELTTKTFTEDTTYIIVKTEGDNNDKTQSIRPKRKPPVDLRGPFTCTFPSSLRPEFQCRQIFFNCCDYSLHYRDEHTKRRKAALRCQVCEKRLDRDFDPAVPLSTPMEAVKTLTFPCRVCGQIFLNSDEFDEHNRILHAKMKPHQCNLCSKRFTQQGGLQQHMRMHSGIRPFACTFCPKAFTQKAGLDQHLRTHTKVKPFGCVICTKRFSQSVHLRQHMRTHTNIQPFECTVCGKSFKQRSHLNFHMKSHVSDGTLPIESYAQVIQEQKNLDFLSLVNLQPVQDGEMMYYSAELDSSILPDNYPYQSELSGVSSLF